MQAWHAYRAGNSRSGMVFVKGSCGAPCAFACAADMLKEEKTGGKKFMDFGGEILPYAAANNIKVCPLGQTCMC